jgi:DNA-binding CsgD family transcriptional regulator
VLSERQRECVRLQADGLPYKAIAARLKITEATVWEHLNNARARLGIFDTARLIKWAFVNGLSPL